MSEVPSKSDAEEAFRLKMEKIMTDLAPLAKLIQDVKNEPQGIDAAAISEKEWGWGEHQGNVMGAKMVKFYQTQAPEFKAEVARTVGTYATQVGGMLNADQIINGRKFNWLKTLGPIIIVGAVIVILLSNPVTSTDLFEWLGKGNNAIITMIFVAAILFMVVLIIRRRQPEPVR